MRDAYLRAHSTSSAHEPPARAIYEHARWLDFSTGPSNIAAVAYSNISPPKAAAAPITADSNGARRRRRHRRRQLSHKMLTMAHYFRVMPAVPRAFHDELFTITRRSSTFEGADHGVSYLPLPIRFAFPLVASRLHREYADARALNGCFKGGEMPNLRVDFDGITNALSRLWPNFAHVNTRVHKSDARYRAARLFDSLVLPG